jgi:CRISPR-associated protein Csd1
MILQSLYRYYQRLRENPAFNIAPEGFGPQKISFALDLAPDGNIAGVIDLRVPEGKGGKLVPREMILPALGQSRTGNLAPNFLWDKTTFSLGGDNSNKPDVAHKSFAAFAALHRNLLAGVRSPEALALLAFLDKWTPEKAEELEHWEALAGTNLVFRLGSRYVHECPEAAARWNNAPDDREILGICLVSGEHTAIARLHPPIKGVFGAQSSGAAVSSYNKNSFESFGKTQNLNAPVGKYAAFAYAAALNYLLKEKSQCLRFGAQTAVCWAEKESAPEKDLFALLTGQESPESRVDVAGAQRRAALLRHIAQGKPLREVCPELDPDVSMHVLGLSPNAARLAVSFYLQGPAGFFLGKIRAYYQELSIDRYAQDAELPSVWQLARVLLGQRKDISDISRLGGDILRAILGGYPYPASILPMALARLRAGDSVGSVLAGLIKAILIRNFNCEVPMLLNLEHPSQTYHLGRVFALLCGLQRKAIPGVKAGIREKYYGAASTTPALIFPLLLANAQNHVNKAKAWKYDRLVAEILGQHVQSFPKHMSMLEQGEFALGFYHQRVSKASADADAEAVTLTEDETGEEK